MFRYHSLSEQATLAQVMTAWQLCFEASRVDIARITSRHVRTVLCSRVTGLRKFGGTYLTSLQRHPPSGLLRHGRHKAGEWLQPVWPVKGMRAGTT